MKVCPFCAESIQDAAIVCKHCRRDLPPAPAAAPSSTTMKPNGGSSWPIVAIVLGLLALVVVVNHFSQDAGPSTPAPSRKVLDVTVRWGIEAVEVTNAGSGGAVGQELIVYVNGSPPFAYKAVATVPPLGESVRIPLITFTQRDGTRFNPIATAVTVAWVGGGGYDYQSFGR